MRKPWQRNDTGNWYVTVNRKQYNLGPDRKKAEKKYHALMQRQGEPEDRLLSFCIDEYQKSLHDCVETTQQKTRHFLGRFLAHVGDLKVSKLKAHHLEDFLKGKPWKPNTIQAVIARVEACLNHCERMGWIERNPIKGKVKKPKIQRREEIMSTEDRRKVLDAAEGPFLSILMGLNETGCRPIELRFARVEKCDLAKNILTVRNKTRDKTGQQERPVFLSSKMIELCRELIGDRKEGWLFQNSFRKQWTRTALQHRLEKLCARLGITKGATLYSFRHGFASTMINERGMNPALVAIQLGHSDLKMLLKTYLHSDSAAMRKALDEVTAQGDQ